MSRTARFSQLSRAVIEPYYYPGARLALLYLYRQIKVEEKLWSWHTDKHRTVLFAHWTWVFVSCYSRHPWDALPTRQSCVTQTIIIVKSCTGCNHCWDPTRRFWHSSDTLNYQAYNSVCTTSGTWAWLCMVHVRVFVIRQRMLHQFPATAVEQSYAT